MAEDRVLRASQVERRLSISRSMVCRLAAQGELRGFKVGRDWRIYEKSVDEYRKRQENAQAA